MFQAAVSSISNVRGSEAKEQYIRAYRWMLLARALDDKFASLYRGGQIHGGVFLGRGQEALSVACGMALRPGDIFAPLIRDAAGRLCFGEPVLDAVRTYLGSSLGPMRGREGNIHRGRPKDGIYSMISHLGAMISVVNGALMARRMRGEHGTVGLASAGDGTTSTGSFHEGLNQAAVEKLPMVVVIADNQYAYSTPTARQYACQSLVERAAGYGVPGHQVDGTDLAACLSLLGSVAARAREGAGPQLVVASLLRLCGHGEHDDAHYVDAQLKQSALGRDCVKLAAEYVVARQWADEETLQQWRLAARREVEEAVATVQREPAPDPFEESWTALCSAPLREAGDGAAIS